VVRKQLEEKFKKTLELYDLGLAKDEDQAAAFVNYVANQHIKKIWG